MHHDGWGYRRAVSAHRQATVLTRAGRRVRAVCELGGRLSRIETAHIATSPMVLFQPSYVVDVSIPRKSLYFESSITVAEDRGDCVKGEDEGYSSTTAHFTERERSLRGVLYCSMLVIYTERREGNQHWGNTSQIAVGRRHDSLESAQILGIFTQTDSSLCVQNRLIFR